MIPPLVLGANSFKFNGKGDKTATFAGLFFKGGDAYAFGGFSVTADKGFTVNTTSSIPTQARLSFSNTADTQEATVTTAIHDLQTVANIPYVDNIGNKTATEAVVLSDGTRYALGTAGQTKWYVVNSDVIFENRITVNGTVNIILTDGYTLNASRGIRVAEGNALNIYAQSFGDNSGKLLANHEGNDAAIGGNGGAELWGWQNGEKSGTITIYGGDISTTGNIGGGNGYNQESGNAGYVDIYGGTIYVDGSIGGGNSAGGSVNLSWTHVENKYFAKNYNGTVTLNKDFMDNGGTVYSTGVLSSNSNISDKEIFPSGTTYAITIGGSYSPACLEADLTQTMEGKTVHLSAINGYSVSSVTVTDADQGNVSVTDTGNGTWTFTMPAKAVTVTPTATLAAYRISAPDEVQLSTAAENILTQNGTYYKAGATITITIDDDFIASSLTVKDANSQSIDVTDKGSGIYTFTMPASNVTISGTFTSSLTTLEGTGYFTVTAGSGFGSGNEGPENLLDGKYSSENSTNYSKWCTSVTPYYVEFNSINPIIPKQYVLVTGNDNTTWTGRNPQSWTIMARLTETDVWTTIAEVSNDNTMEDVNYESYTFNFNNPDNLPYKYFRFEITALHSGNVLQLSEMMIKVRDGIVLADNADNSTAIYAHNGLTNKVTLKGRTLTKDGNWNTLCLPFAVGDATATEGHHFDGTPLEGATVKELDAANTNLSDTGELTLKFKDATSIEAGKPYIVKWTTKGDPISNPVFNNVTINANASTEVTSTDGKVMFVGQYSPFTIDSSNINEILYIASGNKVGYSKNPRTLKSFRAHFWVMPNGTSNGNGAGARVINLNFGDGEVNGISVVTAEGAQMADGIYTLDGRKLNSLPTNSGIYVVNGRKVVVK